MSKLRLSGATSGYEEIKTADAGDNNTYQVGSTVTDAQGNVRALEVTTVTSTPYTIASGSTGKFFSLGSGSNVVTINNSNFAVGDIITIYNRLQAATATLNFSGFTLAHIAGDATNKSSMTLSEVGICTLIYERSGVIVVNGNVS
mgnify:CR=1 FL=1